MILERLVLNSQSSPVSFLSVKIVGMYDHAKLKDKSVITLQQTHLRQQHLYFYKLHL